MDLRQGILSTAGALGVNPVDLATAISYETAGTFDATKRGPTTQWGQHRGLIQFGEPQARKYGVNWDDPLGSQLGPNGAVANYLRDTGVKPGMGLLDIYSAINAGGVGRYNRSDANNGGAPGTVRDKVEQQMAGHRRKAEALMGGQAPMTGGQSQPVAVGGAQQDTLEAAPMQNAGPMQQGRQPMFFKNMDPDRRDRLIMALQGMTMNPNQGLMAMAQQSMQERSKQRSAGAAEAKDLTQANKTAAWLAQQPGGQHLAEAIAMGAIPAGTALQMWQKSQQGEEPTTLQQNYAAAVSQGFDGTIVDYQIELKKAGASSTTINTGDQGQRIGTIPQGYTVIEDPNNDAGFRMVPIPGGPEDNTEQQAIADQGTRRSGDVVIEDIDRILGMMNDGGLPITGGVGSVASMVPGTQAHDAGKLLQTVRANVGFDRLQQMRDSSPTGGALGAINQSEMTLLNSALGALEQSQSQEQFRFNLVRLKGIYKEIVHGAQRLGANPSPVSPSPQGLSDDDLLKKYGGGQ